MANVPAHAVFESHDVETESARMHMLLRLFDTHLAALQTVEVLQLTPAMQRLGLYGLGDLLASQVLPDLRLTVDDIFPEFDFARS